MPDSIQLLDDLTRRLEQLRAALADNAEEREAGPSRVISRQAKTIHPGMFVEFPDRGWAMVTGWTMTDNRVLLSAVGQCFWTVRPHQRIRTRISNGP